MEGEPRFLFACVRTVLIFQCHQQTFRYTYVSVFVGAPVQPEAEVRTIGIGSDSGAVAGNRGRRIVMTQP